jgi:hypothetical protein
MGLVPTGEAVSRRGRARVPQFRFFSPAPKEVRTLETHIEVFDSIEDLKRHTLAHDQNGWSCRNIIHLRAEEFVVIYERC